MSGLVTVALGAEGGKSGRCGRKEPSKGRRWRIRCGEVETAYEELVEKQPAESVSANGPIMIAKMRNEQIGLSLVETAFLPMAPIETVGNKTDGWWVVSMLQPLGHDLVLEEACRCPYIVTSYIDASR
ncbi:hypothetical protein H6P81_003759 [Aristolochia fimbriata]|uniref:Uncharacterized protein n=1 Tax=Aristolochia fimbriata TaxID=158543 RepID=A0AAV7FGK8_ARIFI|nr:hypothetical protein H6P81_003759 [Aristolochia fimbriata]